MLRWLYIQLLWAHPAQFRRRFCDEMLEIFDLAGGRRESLRFFFDGLISLVRQWTIRSEFRQPWQPAGATGNGLVFHLIEPYKLRPLTQVQGALIAMLLLLGVVAAMNHGRKLRGFAIGVHSSRPGLIAIDRDSVGAADLSTTVRIGPERDDPWRPLAIPYFRLVRVLHALDTDGDLAISRGETINAPTTLRKLDLDHDGALSAEECGFIPGKFDPAIIGRLRRNFMREHPVLAALDSDIDGGISAAEMANSLATLRTLDRNRDGFITAAELIPDESETQAGAILSWLDIDDDGNLSPDERFTGDALPLKALLNSADHNRDGRVTLAELIAELALRTETRRHLEWARRSIR
jgi:hypothetical protein